MCDGTCTDTGWAGGVRSELLARAWEEGSERARETEAENSIEESDTSLQAGCLLSQQSMKEAALGTMNHVCAYFIVPIKK